MRLLPIMQIGLIADIHANSEALSAVLRRLRGNVDVILCAGDLTGYYARPHDVFRILENEEVIWIAGNHERLLSLRSFDSLNNLIRRSVEFTLSVIDTSMLTRLTAEPTHKWLELDGLQIAVYHGSPWDSVNEYIFPDFTNWERFTKLGADLIVLGHTHVPFVQHVEDTIVVNPGSCGQPRDCDPRAAFAVFDTCTKRVRVERSEYELEKVCKEIEVLGFDPILQKVLRTGSTHA